MNKLKIVVIIAFLILVILTVIFYSKPELTDYELDNLKYAEICENANNNKLDKKEYDFTSINTLAKSIVKEASDDYEKVLMLVEWEMQNFFHAYENWNWTHYNGKTMVDIFDIPIEDLFEERIVGCHTSSKILIELLKNVGIEAQYWNKRGHGVVYIPSINRYVHGDYIADFEVIPGENIIMTEEKINNYAYSERGYLKFHDEQIYNGSTELAREENSLYLRNSFLKGDPLMEQKITYIKERLPEYNLKFEYTGGSCLITSNLVPIISLKEIDEFECIPIWSDYATSESDCINGKRTRILPDLSSCLTTPRNVTQELEC
jgi:hypothetical protein